MEYSYKVLDIVFHWMISKEKDVEVRLFNDKSKMIKEGDYIVFYNIDTKESIKTKVISKEIFENIDKLVCKYDINRIMPNHTINDVKVLFSKIENKKIDDIPVVGFIFEIVEVKNE